MKKIVQESVEITVGKVYHIKSNDFAFYEKITKHFIKYDDDSGELSIKQEKISKKTFEKLKKTLDKSNQM